MSIKPKAMNRKSKPVSRLSYSGRHSELSQRTPISLRNHKPTSLFFNDQADPLHKKQRKALQQTESQRREAMDEGSLMVKLHKPLPELKPNNAHRVLRKSFNQDWIKEHRRAVLKTLQTQQRHKEKNRDNNVPEKSKRLSWEP